MTDYVSKEELRKFFEGIVITVGGRTRAEAISEVLQAVYNGVMELPTTDAVPVIICRDCKYRYTDGENVTANYCLLNHNRVQADDWFCADAERKEE